MTEEVNFCLPTSDYYHINSITLLTFEAWLKWSQLKRILHVVHTWRDPVIKKVRNHFNNIPNFEWYLWMEALILGRNAATFEADLDSMVLLHNKICTSRLAVMLRNNLLHRQYLFMYTIVERCLSSFVVTSREMKDFLWSALFFFNLLDPCEQSCDANTE